MEVDTCTAHEEREAHAAAVNATNDAARAVAAGAVMVYEELPRWLRELVDGYMIADEHELHARPSVSHAA